MTALALRPGRTVTAGALADEVWNGDPPADATGALQALVARARRALGHAAIVTADGGYRLCADPEDVDLYRFERLAGEGAKALDAGDPGKAAALLDEALGLWHGPVLAGLPDRTAEAARWEARRLAARRGRLAALVGLGRAEEALPELTALCDDHPIDEPLHSLRLRALRDTGRTAQRSRAYDDSAATWRHAWARTRPPSSAPCTPNCSRRRTRPAALTGLRRTGRRRTGLRPTTASRTATCGPG